MRTVALETVRAIHDVTVVRVDEISQHDSDKYPDGTYWLKLHLLLQFTVHQPDAFQVLVKMAWEAV